MQSALHPSFHTIPRPNNSRKFIGILIYAPRRPENGEITRSEDFTQEEADKISLVGEAVCIDHMWTDTSGVIGIVTGKFRGIRGSIIIEFAVFDTPENKMTLDIMEDETDFRLKSLSLHSHRPKRDEGQKYSNNGLVSIEVSVCTWSLRAECFLFPKTHQEAYKLAAIYANEDLVLAVPIYQKLIKPVYYKIVLNMEARPQEQSELAAAKANEVRGTGIDIVAHLGAVVRSLEQSNDPEKNEQLLALQTVVSSAEISAREKAALEEERQRLTHDLHITREKLAQEQAKFQATANIDAANITQYYTDIASRTVSNLKNLAKKRAPDINPDQIKFIEDNLTNKPGQSVLVAAAMMDVFDAVSREYETKRVKRNDDATLSLNEISSLKDIFRQSHIPPTVTTTASLPMEKKIDDPIRSNTRATDVDWSKIRSTFNLAN